MKNKKFISWGFRNINSTHSFIHYAYKKAFESMGWKSYWFDNQDDVSNFDFSDCLFLTAGGADQKIPVRKDCRYILHNCDLDKYLDVIDNSIILQVYTKSVLERDVEKINSCVFYQKNGNVLYQPWATDFLPSEINLLDRLDFNSDKNVNWVGSIWNNSQNQGNIIEMEQLKISLLNRGINFTNLTKIPYDDNKKYINESFISPSVQGKWQIDNNYIPCRVFKNISYGEFGITNSKSVSDLFNGMLVYDNNIDNMVEKSIERRYNIKLSELNDQISFVRNNHTYINRIKTILDIWK
jgi:hypothetical protein